MSSTTRRRLALPALALAGALALTGCSGNDGTGTATATATTGSSPSQAGNDHTGSSKGGAEGNAADVSFLTGMRPHHEQAVEMSNIVLGADPPAEVAAVARQIQAAQSPEIVQMERMLGALGEQADGGAHAGHSSGHGGMMSDGDLAALEAATGTDAARRYLVAMIAHHQGAVEAAGEEIADGRYGPAVALAKQIKTAQEMELRRMQALLKTL